MRSFGFPPVSSASARVLVLGSLPGQRQLELGEYYANVQNVFWRIMATRVLDLPPNYASRVAALVEYRIALWDVLAAATRPGSLDASIEDDGVPNNFRAFFPRPSPHPADWLQWRARRENPRSPCDADTHGRSASDREADAAVDEWGSFGYDLRREDGPLVGDLEPRFVRTAGTHVQGGTLGMKQPPRTAIWLASPAPHEFCIDERVKWQNLWGSRRSAMVGRGDPVVRVARQLPPADSARCHGSPCLAAWIATLRPAAFEALAPMS